MITDERLNHIMSISTDPDTVQLAQEVISLRSQKRRLIETGKNLVDSLAGEWEWSGSEAMQDWNALLKEME